MGRTNPPGPAVTFDTARLRIAPMLRGPALNQAAAPIITPAVTAHLPERLRVSGPVDPSGWLDLLAEQSAVMTVHEGAVMTVHEGAGLTGFLTLHAASEAKRMLGYLFAPSAWGQGFATELVQGLVDHLRGIGWHGTLTGGVARQNPASARVLEKAGFDAGEETGGGPSFYSRLLGLRGRLLSEGQRRPEGGVRNGN